MASPDARPPSIIVCKARRVLHGIKDQLAVLRDFFVFLHTAEKAPHSNAGRVYKYEWVTNISQGWLRLANRSAQFSMLD
ncbi:hypothetical protein WAI453_011430 [Rhynchosporium graminicola]